MNLPKGDQRPKFFAVFRSQLPQKCGSVAFDRGARVLFGKSQIEGLSAISFAEASRARAEAMNQPWHSR